MKIIPVHSPFLLSMCVRARVRMFVANRESLDYYLYYWLIFRLFLLLSRTPFKALSPWTPRLRWAACRTWRSTSVTWLCPWNASQASGHPVPTSATSASTRATTSRTVHRYGHHFSLSFPVSVCLAACLSHTSLPIRSLACLFAGLHVCRERHGQWWKRNYRRVPVTTKGTPLYYIYTVQLLLFLDEAVMCCASDKGHASPTAWWIQSVLQFYEVFNARKIQLPGPVTGEQKHTRRQRFLSLSHREGERASEREIHIMFTFRSTNKVLI